jgi:hypothetical protein
MLTVGPYGCYRFAQNKSTCVLNQSGDRPDISRSRLVIKDRDLPAAPGKIELRRRAHIRFCELRSFRCELIK